MLHRASTFASQATLGENGAGAIWDSQPTFVENGGDTLASQMPGTTPNGSQMPGVMPDGSQMPGVMPSGSQMPGVMPNESQMPGVVPTGSQMPGVVPTPVRASVIEKGPLLKEPGSLFLNETALAAAARLQSAVITVAHISC